MPTPDHWMKQAAARPQSRGRLLGGSLLFMLFGGVFLYFLLPEILLNFNAARWNHATCTILSARVAQQESREDGVSRTLYRVEVRYAYEAGGNWHESTRYRFVDPYTDNRSAVERTVDSFPAGSIVPCYIDPAHPEQAVLDRRLSPFNLIVLLPAVFVALGLWSMGALVIDVIRELVRGQ